MSSQTQASTRLAELLLERDIRVERVAADLMVNSRTVSRWLAGNNVPTPTMARRLGEYFEVDWREFYEAAR